MKCVPCAHVWQPAPTLSPNIVVLNEFVENMKTLKSQEKAMLKQIAKAEIKRLVKK